MPPTLVFDIETIPDVAGLRRIHSLPAALADADVLDWALQQRRAATGGEFLQLHLHRVVAIACALREGQTFRVWSLGEATDAEPETASIATRRSSCRGTAVASICLCCTIVAWFTA
jgi:predicted PolB exonuclease-like 3'-5' exonuclease